jgi:hypothetical protein
MLSLQPFDTAFRWIVGDATLKKFMPENPAVSRFLLSIPRQPKLLEISSSCRVLVKENNPANVSILDRVIQIFARGISCHGGLTTQDWTARCLVTK